MFSTYSPLFCCLSTRGPDVSHPTLRFLYNFGNPGLLCATAPPLHTSHMQAAAAKRVTSSPRPSHRYLRPNDRCVIEGNHFLLLCTALPSQLLCLNEMVTYRQAGRLPSWHSLIRHAKKANGHPLVIREKPTNDMYVLQRLYGGGAQMQRSAHTYLCTYILHTLLQTNTQMLYRNIA